MPWARTGTDWSGCCKKRRRGANGGFEAQRLEKKLDRERQAEAEEAEKVAALMVDKARFEERASAAETRAGELKTQFEGFQEKFAAALERAKPRTTRKKAPAPKPQEPR